MLAIASVTVLARVFYSGDALFARAADNAEGLA